MIVVAWVEQDGIAGSSLEVLLEEKNDKELIIGSMTAGISKAPCSGKVQNQLLPSEIGGVRDHCCYCH